MFYFLILLVFSKLPFLKVSFLMLTIYNSRSSSLNKQSLVHGLLWIWLYLISIYLIFQLIQDQSNRGIVQQDLFFVICFYPFLRNFQI